MALLRILAIFGLLFVAAPLTAEEPSAEKQKAGEEFFEKKIRPLLAEHCFSCHAKGQKKGGLDLGSLQGLLAGGESGAALAPGQPADSLLIRAVQYDGDYQMPPNGRLPDHDVAALKEWVRMGAPWPATAAAAGTIRQAGAVTAEDRQFWSFQPVQRTPVPSVKNTEWTRGAIDRYVAAERESQQIAPVAQADKPSWLRRASFDLTGLPPTLDEVEAFVADDRPDAFERTLDRLLASPRYGERWGRHWLDVARYAEDQAHTFAARVYPSGFRFRDWVVGSLNSDLPYDEFITRQLAGDLTHGGELESHLPALGFFALGPVYYADAGCAPKAKMDELDDRIDTLCRGFLGLTVSCARCHDHKFDPITVNDYYALAGVFASSEYKELPMAPPDVVKAYDAQAAAVTALEKSIKEAEEANQRTVSEAISPHLTRYVVAAWKLQNRRKTDGKLTTAAAAKNEQLEEFALAATLKFLEPASLAKYIYAAELKKTLEGFDAKVDLSADEQAIAAVTSGAAAIQKRLNAALEAQRKNDETYAQAVTAAEAGAKVKVQKKKLDRAEAEVLKELLTAENAPLRTPRDQFEKRIPSERREELAALRKELDERRKSLGPKYPTAHALIEGKPANVKVHLRGDHKQLGDEAPRRFLEVLTAGETTPFSQGSGRLELARAIASPDNPLTARVLVNRLWQHHFGRGLVGSPSNFGMLGQRPTHPRLLDHLAAWFLDNGWSIKRTHREIMTSATYRLASRHDDRNYEQDPDNRLLWRMNRRRLDVEAWRDSLLATSGNLSLPIGGPSFGLNDAGSRRRTFYAKVSRHELDGTLRLFDFPDPNLTSEQRVVTTVPMQQLFVLNSEFMVRQARDLAARLLKEPATDDAARVRRLYQFAFSRSPSAVELEIGGQFLKNVAGANVGANVAKLSVWEQYAQALLASNEFLFVD